MRFKELFEYKRDITGARLGTQLVDAIAGSLKASVWVSATISKLKEVVPALSITLGNRTALDDDDIQNVRIVLNDNMDKVLKFFEDADPTANKQYTEWLVRRYIDGGIRYLEDVDSTVAENLSMYHELKMRRKLPSELADIGRVKSQQVARFFRDVYNIYKELPEVQEKMVKGEAEQVYDDSEIRVIRPEDQSAACYYGQGTRWCTASTKSRNYFQEYNKDGPLYIVIPKNPKHKGEKYQLHFESYSFMDENDAGVDIYKLMKRWPQLHKLFHKNIVDTHQEALYRGDGGGTALLADPETLENWSDIIEDKIKPAVLKELETPVSVYNWLGLAPLESSANAIINSNDYTKDEKFLAKKKIEWIDKIAEHISENEDQVIAVIDRTIGNVDVINESLKKYNGNPPTGAINAIPTMFPGVDTMQTDIGDRYLSGDIRTKILNRVWRELALLISPYFGNSFKFLLVNT